MTKQSVAIITEAVVHKFTAVDIVKAPIKITASILTVIYSFMQIVNIKKTFKCTVHFCAHVVVIYHFDVQIQVKLVFLCVTISQNVSQHLI